MNTLFFTYLVYVAVSVGLTIWVARTLSRNGAVFLVDVFRGNEALARSVNHLLVVGFYLISLGYVCLNLKVGIQVVEPHESIEALATKVGFVLLVLGGMHFLNLFVFSRIRRHASLSNAPLPAAPDAILPAPTAGPLLS